MRNTISKLSAGFAALVLTLCGIRLLLTFPVSAETDPETAAAEILAAQSSGTIAEWVDSLADAPAKGANDWYMLALAHSGEYALETYADALISEYQAQPPSAAASRERMALTMIACADSVPDICTDILRDSIGKQGIMSWVFGLHLLNNGVSAEISIYEAVSEILAAQCADGGWAVMGQYGDPDVTAMTLQALAPYQHTAPAADAIQNAVAFLSKKQLDSGAFSSYGTENPESTAQVLIALQSLGIQPDDPRFVKSGSLLDGIMQFSLGNGRYAHELGGGANETAALQVFLALTALRCDEPFYLYHGANPVMEVPAVTTSETVPATTAPHSEQTTTIRTASQTVQTQNTQETAAAVSAETVTAAETASLTTASGISGTLTVSSANVSAVSSAASSGTSAVTASASDETAALSSSTEKTAAVQTAVPAEAPPSPAKYPYQIPVTAGAGAVFIIGAAVCFVRGKRSPKTYLTLAFFCGGVIALAWIIRIESPAQYYQKPDKAGDAGSVSMAIRCDVILGMDGAEKYPADGVILPETDFALDTGDTVLDVLYDAVKTYGLQIEVDGVSGDVIDNAYVRGIASLYEFDFGDLSGWTYTVNGERPSVGAGAFFPHDGDVIVWAYTVSL